MSKGVLRVEIGQVKTAGALPIVASANPNSRRNESHELHPKALVALKRLMELVIDGGGQLSIVLIGHPKLKNDLRASRFIISRPSQPSCAQSQITCVRRLL
jgi:hypothetical protein